MELFSFRGRVRRTTNLLTQIALNVTGWVLGTISAPLVSDHPSISLFLLLAIGAGTYICLASYVKRAHDVGRSALFALGPYLTIMILVFGDIVGDIIGKDIVISDILVGGWLIYFSCVFLWVTFKAGDPETNRYGEAPKPPSA